MKVKRNEASKEITVTIREDDDFQPSGSGKSLIVASTRGPSVSDVRVNGKALVVSLNAYVVV